MCASSVILKPTLMSHPHLDELSDLLTSSAAGGSTRVGGRRARIAAHVAQCTHCQESLRFIRTVNSAADSSDAVPALPDALFERVMRTRAEGQRVLLPTAETAPVRSGRHWVFAVAAAILLAVVGIGLASKRDDVEAGTTSGTLQVTPAAPQRGQSVTVHYRPAARLAGQPWLALRARLRSPAGGSYDYGMSTETLARLRRGASGTYEATVALPDSVVYAALAVEDSTGAAIDENGGRLWEVLVAAPDGRPSYTALEQRANDLMGRNWEEGFANVQRMVGLYPEDMRAWNWLLAQQRWLGRQKDDSVRRVHAARVARYDAQLREEAHPSGDDMGLLAWYASPIDSAIGAYWKARVLREAQANSFPVQWRLFAQLDTLRMTHDTATVLRRLEELWAEAPADRRQQVAEYTLGIALAAATSHPADSSTALRWAMRRIETDRNQMAAAQYVALRLTHVPVLRATGMIRLRSVLAALDSLSPTERGLTEVVTAQRDRHAVAQRATLAALGRALVADGQTAAALDTLALAAAVGWDLETFQAVRAASLTAGDTATAQRMASFIAADPRADAAFVDSARRVLPAEMLQSGRTEFARRMMDGASVRTLSGRVELRDARGRAYNLRQLGGGHVTVVAFWSPFCGPALADLPRLQLVADRLARDGIRVVSVVDEQGQSAAVTAALRDNGVRLPTYFDTARDASRAFNQWGTPSYYVLDVAGHVRFNATSSADEALARAEAVRLSR